ncbi:MAG: 6-phosphofructokinase [Lentisphaerae bacterium GWF2_52_8]|nr:MAG: 6-phosphofructokinase [Lentisphaerae bacterium GWF2_52_8]
MKKIKKIGVLTGGGDCPGLNAVIRAVVKSALNRKWGVVGIKGGFEGLMDTSNAKDMHSQDIAGILHIGGTILGTTNRGNPFEMTVKKGGKTVIKDMSDSAVAGFYKLGLDALVCIGGDGTLGIAEKLQYKGVPIVGVPKTIDNDLSATVITFGFDTAVNTATDALDKLHSTAESHKRVMVVEVMGRYAGWIALNSGISGGADVILIPEIPFDMDKVCRKVNDRYRTKRNFCIIVAAEGAKPKGGGLFTKKHADAGRQEVLLGGIAEWIAKEVKERTGRDTRSLVLGHLQRGGTPTTFDRLIATRFGAAAVRAIEKNSFGVMIALRPPDVVEVPIREAIGRMKSVPLDSDEIVTGRDLGICFGD